MRLLAITSLALASVPVAATGASAQVMSNGYGYSAPVSQNFHGGSHEQWGGTVNGRWIGGSEAPGGWSAYRAPSRGYQIPYYWMEPRFYIQDYSNWGLSQPPSGYHWVRYYDDAVLVDNDGRVNDWMSDLDWNSDEGASGQYGYGSGYGYRSGGQNGYGYPTGGNYGYSTGDGYSSAHAYSYSQVQPSCGCGGYVWAPATVVTVTPGTTTTTTTTTEEWVEAAPRPVVTYHAPSKLIRRPIKGKRILRSYR